MEKVPQCSVSEICDLFVAFANNYLNKIPRKNKKEYKVTDWNIGVIRDLVLYFTDHPESKLDPSKGIYIMGTVGTGKSTLLEIIDAWPLNKKKFLWARCKALQRDYTLSGFKNVDKYGIDAYRRKNNVKCREYGYAITYCFDDFGEERISKSYGTEALIMEDIIQDRYVEFESTGMITHITTNIQDADIIEKIYGIRVRDRIRAMFNIVKLNGPTFRV